MSRKKELLVFYKESSTGLTKRNPDIDLIWDDVWDIAIKYKHGNKRRQE